MTIRESLYEKSPPWMLPATMAAGAAANALLGTMDEAGWTPLFLDSTFTIIFAALYGPAVGFWTATMSTLFSEALLGFDGSNFAFMLCGICAAAIVGILSRRGLLSTFPQALVCSIFVGLIDSVVGALIDTYLYRGNSGREIDYYAAALAAPGTSLFQAELWARVSIDMIDKGIPVFISFIFLRSIAKPGSAAR
jgi:hypothetical protein